MNSQTLTTFKIETEITDVDYYDNFETEFEILSLSKDTKKNENIKNIDEEIFEIEKELKFYDQEIDRLTNHSDGFDYSIAVSCGVICGLIDSFIIGEFNFERGKSNANEQVNKFITKFAKMQGYEGDRLKGAIEFLEKKFPVAQDNIWKGADIGVSARNHHLADLAHHPTLLGLFASIIVQFFRVGIFVNKDGEWNFESIDTDPKELLKIWLPIIISGVLLWIVSIVESKYADKIDEKIPRSIQKLIKLIAAAPALISILKVAGNWVGHLVSDMGGSKNTAGGGMGIPGLFLSLLHEISSLPILKDTELPKIVNDLYSKNKFDMRSELAVLNELGRQAIPVLLGEVLVRTFYFIRRLIKEYQEHKNLKSINWHNAIPFNNRTIVRMMTIESSTFTAIDLADAAIRSSLKNGLAPNNPLFWKDFALRVNFVGVGRFVIAVGTDIGMGIKNNSLKNDRITLHTKIITLQNSKILFLQENMWIEVGNLERSLNDLKEQINAAVIYYIDSYNEIFDNVEQINTSVKQLDSLNAGFKDRFKENLFWG